MGRRWVALAFLALACQEAPVSPDASTYELEIYASTYNKELRLLVDGQLQEPISREGLTDSYRILRMSSSIAEAPPVVLQSSGGSVADTMGIAPGSICREVCGDCLVLGTLVGESTSLGIATDGTLLDSHEVGGCISCTGTTLRRTGCP